MHNFTAINYDAATMGTIGKIYRFYRDGFREMTTGRTLWVIILVKLFIMFAILKVFFFRISSPRALEAMRKKAVTYQDNL